MRVYVVNPSSKRDSAAGVYSETMLPMAPRGIAGIAAVADALGHETYMEDQYATRSGAEEIAAFVKEKDIHILAMGCLSPNMPMVESIARRVKKTRPDTHVVLGNTHASYFAEDILKRLPIDSIVMGEGETAFRELLMRLEAGRDLEGARGISRRRDSEAVLSDPAPQIDDLDALPYPAWKLLRLDHYIAPPRLIFRDRLLALEASRGCPWKCSFCSQNLAAPRVVRRSLVSVVEEIEWAIREFGVTSFGFVDAIFPLNEKEGLNFAALMGERGLSSRVRWFSTTRSDLVSEKLLRALKESGCRFLLYGFESASDKHLDAVGKNLDTQAAYRAMLMTRRAGLLSYGVFMIGFPGETVAEARRTIRYAKRLDCDVASFARVTPYPGTPMYEQYKEHFPGDTPPWQWNNQYRAAKGERIWELPGLPHDRISALLREAMLSFYLRPRIIVRHLRLGIFSFGDMLRGASFLARDALTKLSRFGSPGRLFSLTSGRVP